VICAWSICRSKIGIKIWKFSKLQTTLEVVWASYFISRFTTLIFWTGSATS
jgi:hypothetical protein